MSGSSLPMIRRCAEAQWRGLEPSERAILLTNPQVTHVANWGQGKQPIWYVVHETTGTVYDLISIKEDHDL